MIPLLILSTITLLGKLGNSVTQRLYFFFVLKTLQFYLWFFELAIQLLLTFWNELIRETIKEKRKKRKVKKKMIINCDSNSSDLGGSQCIGANFTNCVKAITDPSTVKMFYTCIFLHTHFMESFVPKGIYSKHCARVRIYFDATSKHGKYTN